MLLQKNKRLFNTMGCKDDMVVKETSAPKIYTELFTISFIFSFRQSYLRHLQTHTHMHTHTYIDTCPETQT